MGDMRNAYRNVVGNPKGKRLFVRPRHEWEDNIKIIIEVAYYRRFITSTSLLKPTFNGSFLNFFNAEQVYVAITL
jgi:hypothetical protein